MSRPWLPLYVADYLRDTRRLTPAEHGAYLLLIMEYWTAGGLPGDDRQMCRITGMTAREWQHAKPIISTFFTPDWRHKRIDAELAKAAEISSKRSASAELMHSKRLANASANAEQEHTHARASSQSQERKMQPSAAPVDQEADLFRRGREVLGKSAGGLVKNLLEAKGKNVSLARAALEQAATKGNAREYISGVIRKGNEGDDFHNPMAGRMF